MILSTFLNQQYFRNKIVKISKNHIISFLQIKTGLVIILFSDNKIKYSSIEKLSELMVFIYIIAFYK